jgi:hypothetical protein
MIGEVEKWHRLRDLAGICKNMLEVISQEMNIIKERDGCGGNPCFGECGNGL